MGGIFYNHKVYYFFMTYNALTGLLIIVRAENKVSFIQLFYF